MVFLRKYKKTPKKKTLTETERAKTTLVSLRKDVLILKRRTRGGIYKFQLRKEEVGIMDGDGVPFVISLSDFTAMKPIFQARKDNGQLNDYLVSTNKVKALTSSINYSININDSTAFMFTVTIFIVTLHKTAKLMIDSNVAGVLQGIDLQAEKDYTTTPGPLTSNRSQLVQLNRNIFKVHYAKRHVLGRRISAVGPAGGTTPPTLVTNRNDTNIDRHMTFNHKSKIYKAPYGNGWYENIGSELIQTIAARPYFIVFFSKIDNTGQAGRPSMAFQQVCTLKTVD